MCSLRIPSHSISVFHSSIRVKIRVCLNCTCTSICLTPHLFFVTDLWSCNWSRKRTTIHKKALEDDASDLYPKLYNWCCLLLWFLIFLQQFSIIKIKKKHENTIVTYSGGSRELTRGVRKGGAVQWSKHFQGGCGGSKIIIYASGKWIFFVQGGCGRTLRTPPGSATGHISTVVNIFLACWITTNKMRVRSWIGLIKYQTKSNINS